jgi:lysozyme family protein
MNNFDKAIDYLFEIEGLYSNAPDDNGGETYRGISRKSYPEWEGWKIMDRVQSRIKFKGLSLDGINKAVNTIYTGVYLDNLATFFYKKNFWNPLLLDEVKSTQISLKIFDMSVHFGIKRAVTFIQECIALIDYINADGIMGYRTINSLNELIAKDETFLLSLLTVKQGSVYLKIVASNSHQKDNLRGWIDRLHIKVEIPK